MSALFVVFHKNRPGGVFVYHSSCMFAGYFYCFFGIINNNLLAKSINKVFCTSGNFKFKGKLSGEFNGIANHITPQSGICRYYNCIIFSWFNIFQRDNPRVFRPPFFHGYKFIKNAIVEHQQHVVCMRTVLNTKKTFRGIVGFHVMHLVRWE